MSLAETIERDLADRIQAGRALPARLTLGALADAYGVSATPVGIWSLSRRPTRVRSAAATRSWSSSSEPSFAE